MPVAIRVEIGEDRPTVRAVNESAFARPHEADLVEQLHSEHSVVLSLVAEVNDEIAGHVLFSRMWIDREGGPVAAVALAPVAVRDTCQRQGVGSALIRSGVASLRDRGESARDRFQHILGEGAGMMISRIFLAGLAAAALALAYNGDGFMEKFESLPQAVRDTAKAQMGNAFPVSITSAQGEQGWDYQVNTRLNGKYHDIVIDGKGKLVAVKDETDLASIPAAAQAAIQKQAASSKVITLEKVTQGGQVSYGALIKDGAEGTYLQIRIAPDGTLQSKNQNQAGK